MLTSAIRIIHEQTGYVNAQPYVQFSLRISSYALIKSRCYMVVVRYKN